MKQIKPGRAPSMMSGIVGIFMVVIGIAWTIGAAGMGAPWFFCLFGVVWTCIAGMNTLYNFKNATSKNRYSMMDIVDSSEEPDPLNVYFGNQDDEQEISTFSETDVDAEYCPYCGTKVEQDFRFCHKCGKELPE